MLEKITLHEAYLIFEPIARNIFYKDRDESHGINHVLEVNTKALQLASQLNVTDIIDLHIIQMGSIFHDAYDHKYYNIYESDVVKLKFARMLSCFSIDDRVIHTVLNIIDNISFSKELKLRQQGIFLEHILDPHTLYLRNIVSDADKITSLGYNGIVRMYQFKLALDEKQTQNIEDHTDHIYNHYQKKLSRLVYDGFIKFSQSIAIANDLLKEMDVYCRDKTTLRELIMTF
jgi:HD superfamily phosphodiesterase